MGETKQQEEETKKQKHQVQGDEQERTKGEVGEMICVGWRFRGTKR